MIKRMFRSTNGTSQYLYIKQNIYVCILFCLLPGTRYLVPVIGNQLHLLVKQLTTR